MEWVSDELEEGGGCLCRGVPGLVGEVEEGVVRGVCFDWGQRGGVDY